MISVESLSKVFRLYQDPKDRLKEIISRRRFSREITALNDITFTVKEGETLGIIGENGAGKSTLLKILTGILLPTEGEVHVDGNITGLLELGTGFNPEFTGLKNIYMNGLLIGMSREELDSKVNDIIAFTELGKFIDEPVKTYSSGMVMRLAFSIAIHAEPSAFVIDEALSVGDAYFQQKCMKRIREFRENGGSIVFVSHDMNAVKVLCDRALLLSHGSVIEKGEPEKVMNTYNFLLAKKSKGEEIRFEGSGDKKSYGNFRVEIAKVEFLNEHGIDSKIFVSGEEVKIRVHLKTHENVDRAVVGILIRDRFGQDNLSPE
jgi:lipopolysaccharide transport system ATP-binding protein